MTEERFEQIAAEEVDALPEWILELLAEVSIEVDDWPPPQYVGVQALYIGCPPTERAESFWTGREPARIILYRRPLWCEDDDQQREQMRSGVATCTRHSRAKYVFSRKNSVSRPMRPAARMLAMASSSCGRDKTVATGRPD